MNFGHVNFLFPLIINDLLSWSHVSSWVASGRVRPENFDDVEEDGRLDSLVRAVPPAR